MRFEQILVLCALMGSCAKQELPPGTAPDRSPPRAVETQPAYGEVAPDFEGDAWIRFDEPISNPRSFDRTLLASPAGRYRVMPGRSRIRFRPEEGWREGIVYYFALPAGVSDLVNNRTAAPTELLFSTGPEIPPTLVQGRAYDRVTARGIRGARLLFVSADSVPYTAVSDTGGVYRLPGLPYGDYRARAFIDQDRDFEYDVEFEPGAVEAFQVSVERATASVDVWMLPADSTPPILASAELIDSLTMRLTFDDPLDPEDSLAEATVIV
ncbi:MAG: Ig-like domain-containing protein, partial [Gemmatimonadota bacterium]